MFDLEKYLTDLKDEQMKKLEAMKEKTGTTGTTGTMGTTGTTSTDENIRSVTCDKNKNSATSSFKFPISYVDNKQEINENIINDLELVESKNPDEPSM